MIDKNIILVGADGAIGESIQRKLKDEGCHILLVQEDMLDLTDPLCGISLEMFVEGYMAGKNGKFSVVYNAGVDRLEWIDKQSWEDIDTCFNVNTFGLIRALRGFSRNDKANRFVHVCSISATVPQTCTLAYNSSKAAARMASFTAARELAPKGKFVNVVSPGPVEDTAMTDYVTHKVPQLRGWGFDEAEERQMAVVPLRRRIKVDEIAEAVAFLLDGDKSGACVGAELRVSGGL